MPGLRRGVFYCEIQHSALPRLGSKPGLVKTTVLTAEMGALGSAGQTILLGSAHRSGLICTLRLRQNQH